MRQDVDSISIKEPEWPEMMRCTEKKCMQQSLDLIPCWRGWSLVTVKEAGYDPYKVLKHTKEFCGQMLCEKHAIRCSSPGCGRPMCEDHVNYCAEDGCCIPLCEEHHSEGYCDQHYPDYRDRHLIAFKVKP